MADEIRTTLKIGGRPTARQTETHYYLAHCPTCDFGHVSKINMDSIVIRCECGVPFRVIGADDAGA